MLELIVHQEVQVGGVDRPPPPSDMSAVVEKQAVGLGHRSFGRRGRSAFRFRWRCDWRRRQGNTELNGLYLMDIDCLRLIPGLDVKLLDVAGLHQPRDLPAILQSDDIGEHPAAG